MRKYLCLIFVFTCFSLSAQKIYSTKSIKTEFSIDGKGSHAAWGQAIANSDFTLPWNEEEPQHTAFRALHDEQYFYFLYTAEDNDIVAPGVDGDKLGVLPSDRVEIFFKSKGGMNPYYCLELDPRGRVLDYIAHFYRKTDFKWEWPENDLQILAHQTKGVYTVEGKIAKKSLEALDILKNDVMDAGLFRGDYYHVDEKSTDVLWITWVVPENDTPDFHIPSAFGKIRLAH